MSFRGAFLRSEYLGRTYECDPHAPGERNADEGPEQGGLRVQATEANAMRSGRSRAFRARRLQFSDFLCAHVPLRIDGLDQVVADQANDQHSGENVERVVIKVVTRYAGCELGLADVVHDNR